MPALQTKDTRDKNGLLVPILLGGAVLAGVAGWLWWRRRRATAGGAVLVASTAPGQPEIR